MIYDFNRLPNSWQITLHGWISWIGVGLLSLLEHCRRHRYLSQSGEELALLLSSLLENLLAYRTITHDESPEHRMSCTVNVLVSFKPQACTHRKRVKGVVRVRLCWKDISSYLTCCRWLSRPFPLLEIQISRSWRLMPTAGLEENKTD